MATSKNDPKAVEEYLVGLPADERGALEDVRGLVKEAVPEVQERISYGSTIIFATRRDLVGCAAQKQHLSLFTMSPPLTASMHEEISKHHRVSGATIHFSPDNPLPASLVRAIIEARLEEEGNR